jgi:diketogulonate reductase-like aldo/keto reductase
VSLSLVHCATVLCALRARERGGERALQLAYLDLLLVHLPVPLAHVGFEGPAECRWMPVTPANAAAGGGVPLYARGVALEDTWRALEELVLVPPAVGGGDGGRVVRAIGLSNTPASLLHALLARGLRETPAVNQIELHPYLPQAELRAACTAMGVPVQGFAPLASGNAALLAEPAFRAVAELSLTSG